MIRWKALIGGNIETINGIMTLAAQKLCKSVRFNLRDTNQALAVLSQRFDLDIRFGQHDAVSFLQKAVSSHLRVCFSTTKDRAWPFTGYPSEPLLSCVAAHLLYGTPYDLSDVLSVLEKGVRKGVVG